MRWYTEVEDDLRDYAESVGVRDYDRYPAGDCRIAGETAPLLFTALSNQFWSTDIDAAIANLPVTIFKFAMSPFAEWQQLAWAGY
ncbi:phosphate ABC transporter permease [Escherichia coli]|uniref:Phosphate ABC transporter permease n=1 Tax=Escherichia coli TaxID=562 RepID=A0A2X3KLG4_ECOLX|nr:phosphate ABC transporter permease [Escherichia coli]